MGANSGTLQVLANQLGLALGLLEAELADAGLSDLLAKLGLRLPTELAAGTALATAAEAAATEAAGLAPLLQALATAVEADDLTAILSATETLITQIAATVDALGQVETELTAAIASSALTTAQQAQLAAFAGTMAKRVIDYLVVRRLAESAPLLLATLDVAGLLDHEPVDVATDDPLAVSHTRSELHLDRLGTIVSAPADHLKNVYGWGGPDFDALELFGRLQRVLDATGQVQTHLLTPAGQSPLLEAYLLGFQVDDTVTPAGLVVSVRFPGAESFTRSYPLRNPWTIEVDATAAFAEDVRAAITPPFAATLKPPSGTVNATVTAGLHANPPTGMPVVLIGDPGGTRLQADRAAFDAGFAVTWDPVANQATGEPTLSLTLTNGHLIVSLGGADGFLASVLPRTLNVSAAVDAEWRPSTGLVFKSGAALVVTVPVNAQIGPAHITVLDLGLGVGPSALTLGLKLSGDITLGPLALSVKDVGSAVALGFERGNLGPADLTFRFLQPTGLGLSIDAGVVTGGGFLFHDETQQLYAGVMQLSLQDQLTLTAYGLIATKMPDGRRGYSLLIFITAEGFEPIPLGFGFQLEKIGGMVGVNRTFDQDVIKAGLKTDTLATLLFPRNPAANAPALLQALASAFPAKQGSYLLGLIARITWFTPTIVTLDLALILELGARTRLLALGRISSLLPTKDNDLIRLNLDAVGVVDFDAGTLAIDAVLVDSRLVHQFPITGSGAVRAAWSGDGAGFIMSAGGFNPNFAPPASFPPLERVAIALCSGNNPRLVCEAYYAITANTLQWGARASLYAEALGFSVSGDIGYDALITLLPPHFIVDFHASVQLKRGSSNLFKVTIDGRLEGPLPLRVASKVSFEIFWVSFSVHLDYTLVSGGVSQTVPAVALGAQLIAALTNSANWTTRRASQVAQGVALRSLTSSSTMVLEPLGQLVVQQQVVPLNTARDVDTFGGAPVAGDRRFNLTATLNGQAGESVPGPFAPARYFKMSDDEKLAAPSFESMDAGVILGDGAVSFDATTIIPAPLSYETITLNPIGAPVSPPPANPPRYQLPVAAFTRQRPTGAAARVPVRSVGAARFRNLTATPSSSLKAVQWRIVRNSDGTMAPLDHTIDTWSEYRDELDAMNRGGAQYQMIPAHEL